MVFRLESRIVCHWSEVLGRRVLDIPAGRQAQHGGDLAEIQEELGAAHSRGLLACDTGEDAISQTNRRLRRECHFIHL